MSFFIENAWIIPLLPLWIFLIIVFGRATNAYDNKKITLGLTLGSTGIGLLFSIMILIWCIKSPNQSFEQNFTWLSAGNLKFSMGWLIDNLSATMLMVVTSISLLIQLYSHEYMNKDDGYHRFFAYLNFFNFSMLGLVLSTNLFQMYIFWELVGLASYLLIGFWFRRPSAADAAKKAFLVNRIGDFGFLLGLLAFTYFSMQWWTGNHTFLGFDTLPYAAKYALFASSPFLFSLLAFAIFMGPMAKSAQFPLHVWLPDAMEGPTPISALIHAATMVAAGVFLIARAYPIFILSPQIMNIMALIGGITALMAAIIAVTQLDIKKALAYSTCSQLGYMVMAMGVGAYTAGMFHLVTHAYFKAMMFLCSGAVIHGLSNQQDMRYMGGLRKHMPAVAYTYLIGCFAISGILFSGFWSKEEIFTGILASHNLPLFFIAIITAGLTAFYMFRTYFMTFEGEYRGKAHPHNASKVVTVPLILLAIPSAILGFVLSGELDGFGIGSFAQFLLPHHELHHFAWLPLASTVVAIAGVALASVLYWDKVNFIKPSLFKNNMKFLYKLSFNKFYIDEINACLINGLIIPICNFFAAFDKFIVDGFVNLSAQCARFKSYILCLFQTGNVQSYGAIAFSGFIVITLAMLAYWLL